MPNVYKTHVLGAIRIIHAPKSPEFSRFLEHKNKSQFCYFAALPLGRSERHHLKFTSLFGTLPGLCLFFYPGCSKAKLEPLPYLKPSVKNWLSTNTLLVQYQELLTLGALDRIIATNKTNLNLMTSFKKNKAIVPSSLTNP